MAKAIFEKKAPKLMGALLSAFPEWDIEDAAACAGNAGHESNGFTAFQEVKPTVKGSRGGYSWFQWTGPRRRKFEAYCKANDLALTSDEAAIGYTIVELKGPERAAVAKTAQANGLEAKVKAFEMAFERAGIKHYDSRFRWAKIALAAYKPKTIPQSRPVPITDRATVEAVQGHLVQLKYNPGGIDGKIGPLTRDAVLAFRSDNGLSPVDYIDTEFLRVLEHAEPRKMVAERANADSVKIATVVPEVNKHWWNKYVGLGSTVGLVGGGVVKELPDSLPLVQQAKDMFLDIPSIIWIGAAIIIAGVVWWNARQGQIAGDTAYRDGDRR